MRKQAGHTEKLSEAMKPRQNTERPMTMRLRIIYTHIHVCIGMRRCRERQGREGGWRQGGRAEGGREGGRKKEEALGYRSTHPILLFRPDKT